MEQKINGPHFSSWESAVQWLRNQPDRQDLVRSAYYDDPLSEAVDRYYRSEEWAEISLMLPASRGQALDVGAGRGIASYALAREGFKVTALEPDDSQVVGANAIRAMAEETGVDIEVIQDFSEKLPFADHQFDVVFARAVLHHTRDLQAACAEFFRVLKPGGRLIAVREHVISRDEDLQAFLDIHPLHKLYGGENAFRLAQYESAIRKAGFLLDRVSSPLESPVNYFPYTLRSLQSEIAIKVSRNLPVLRTLLEHLLRQPFIWAMALPLLTRLDRRPGRLYSFLATRPA
ncbi:class I SAM-dependent methyltransferase [Herbaspirillum huttiense]|uniref:class I SAM-dependent methyltransferase n=1 Tax=Herbaspirillum huttiense TaxID=863372 RepID=UPI0039B07EF6